MLAIELHRGWNSRLGFSLQGAAGYTYVSAVHADSVAAKDGRLKPGDRLVKVNNSKFFFIFFFALLKYVFFFVRLMTTVWKICLLAK